jgi:hypothetical protein
MSHRGSMHLLLRDIGTKVQLSIEISSSGHRTLHSHVRVQYVEAETEHA